MSLFRPSVDQLHGYVPGEQPQEPGWVKLNTNENPYPPSPAVVEAITRTAKDRLHVYPDPLGRSFCRAAAEVLGVEPEWIIPANGSDENLTILVRTFTDKNDLISYPYPSYILYETLAEIQGTRHARLRLNADWSWNTRLNRPLLEQTKLLFVPNPNSPSGNKWDAGTILSLVPQQGVLVLDEAYGDFADQPHKLELLRGDKGDRIIVTRTFSKSYSLAGLRFGFAVAHPDTVAAMRKVKDSYNCDALSLAAAEAAIRDQAWMLSNRAKIVATRTRLQTALTELGFNVVPSQANFVWCTHPTRSHEELYLALKARKILIRYMKFPGGVDADAAHPEGLLDGLRITIGTDPQVDAFLSALSEII
ncbi:histidinol-phosphate transaminase [Planctomicrobium piriforme]|uniref:Histidinol-phosphate aminotransferase n=1 Tax=Planctomicrobium piriforme TaxID=1576369 RepID=A0A1I3B2Z5_9PLAN|nr:histidinol-phosphate transaminase [Planctomicrobium piriforme]SFH56695.1 histidinol-phosphate aminotransferase [Planctomicrobium piriforme]